MNYRNFSKINVFSHILGTPSELGGTLAETVCKKKTIPSKFVISFSFKLK